MKFIVRSLLVLVAIFGTLFFVNLFGNQGEPLPQGSESAMRAEQGPYKVKHTVKNFVDTNRPTPDNGDHPGTNSRTLTSNLWIPVSTDEQHPLIVYSHGFSANKDSTKKLQAYLASHGYIVVAPDFPLTNTHAEGGPFLFDVKNQPGDISFLIDQIHAMSKDSTSAIYNRVDTESVGVAGLSLGGLTSTLVTYHPSFRDNRVDATVSIAGPTSIFTPAFFAEPNTPFLMLGGDYDVVVSYKENAADITHRIPNSQLITLKSGSHVGFADGASLFRWLDNPDDLGCYVVTSNLESDEDSRWNEMLGVNITGINYQDRTTPCTEQPPEGAMNVLRQTQITRIIVRTFLDSQFSKNIVERRAANTYLQETLVKEIPEARYTNSDENEKSLSAHQENHTHF